MKRDFWGNVTIAVLVFLFLFVLLWNERERRLQSASLERRALEEAVQLRLMADEDGRIIFATPSAAAFLEYGVGELIGKNITELMPEKYRERHETKYRHRLRNGGGGVVTVLGDVTSKSGREKPAYITVHVERVNSHWYSLAVLTPIKPTAGKS